MRVKKSTFSFAWDAFMLMCRNPGALLRAAALPLLLTATINLLFIWLVGLDILTKDFVFYVSLPFKFVAIALFTVAWHRFLLLDLTPRVSIAWTKAHTWVAAWFLVWTLLGLGFLFAFSEIVWIIWLIFLVIFVYLMARSALYMPASSVGRALTLGEIWRFSKPVVGTIYTAGIVVGLVTAVFFGTLLSFISTGLEGHLPELVFKTLQEPIILCSQVFFGGIIVGTISLLYRIAMDEAMVPARQSGKRF